MKVFFTWLIIQCIFARVLFGIMIQLWATFKLPADQVVYFIVPPMIVCVVETVVSAMLLFHIWDQTRRYGK